MAALAQPDPTKTSIKHVVDSISLPEGIELRRFEFRENNLGDPSVFVVYSVLEGLVPDTEMAKRIGEVKWTTIRLLRNLPMALTPYTWFEAA